MSTVSTTAPVVSDVSARRLVRMLGQWHVRGVALHEDLAEGVTGLVRSGALADGVRLPSERALSAALGVSRNTVTKSMDALRGRGLVTSRQGSGTFVTARHRAVRHRGADRLRTFVDDAADGVIDLRSAALPGLGMVVDMLPTLAHARTRELVSGHGYLPAGLPELRKAVAAYYTDAGLETSPRHILITSGAQQALRLAAAMYVAPGRVVLVEEPTFRGAIESLRALGAHLLPVPSGPEGIDTDALATMLRTTRPVLVVLQSSLHNPTGSVLPPRARRRVAALARQYRVPMIDDATLADTVFDPSDAEEPLAVGANQILTVGSVSKSFWGGLRVGWLRAHPDTVAELAATKGGEDLGTSVLAQIAAAGLLSRVDEARSLRREELRVRRDHAIDALAQLLPEWDVQVPRGGGSLWARLPGSGANALAQRAERHGVRILPGSTFSVHDALDDHVRLSYAGDRETTRVGIERLAAAWAALAPRDGDARAGATE